MTEWWTYRPADFLMFSARAWGRLLESWNGALWPLQPVLVAAGLVLVWAAATRPRTAARWIALALALAWAWIAWGFHWQRFAAIHTGAPAYAFAFMLEAALLATLGTRSRAPAPSVPWQRAGLAIAVLAVLGYPLLAPATGRGWAQAEVAGAAPDPTALLTVGLLLALPQRRRPWLLVVPLLALLVGWTTAWLLARG
jgi:hypothetical protein